MRVIEEKERILTIHYLLENFIATGGEAKVVSVYDIATGGVVFTLKGFQNRVKSIVSVPKAPLLPDDVPDDIRNNVSDMPYILTISSDEFLRVWDIDVSSEKAIIQKALRARPTCMTVSLISRASEEEISQLMDTHKQKQQQKLKSRLKTRSDESSDEEDEAEEKEEEKKRDKDERPVFRTREKVVVYEDGAEPARNRAKPKANTPKTTAAQPAPPKRSEAASARSANWKKGGKGTASKGKSKDAKDGSDQKKPQATTNQSPQHKKRPRANDDGATEKPQKLAKHK